MTVVESTAGDLALLTGPDAGDLLSAAVATAGGELVSWRARQVDHRPGSSTTVSYAATVRWADGSVAEETLGASTGLRVVESAPPGVLALSDGTTQVAVWRVPLDPGLPRLAAAMDPVQVGALLVSLGLPEAPVTLRVRAYRPRRRAVVQATSPYGTVFLKVLRAGRAEALHDRHRLLEAAGLPVPRSLGWDDEGLLVLQGLPGTPMRDRLRAGDAVPTGESLLATLDLLPREVLAMPHRPAWTDGVAHYAGVVASAVPEQADRVTQLADRITAALVGSGPADEPTHGDLYESQLLLDGSRLVGLLDVDTAGPGRRTDDLACLLAHLSVLAQMEPGHRATSMAIGAAWLKAFERRVDPWDLRHRVAGVALSLATGPHRVQERGWQKATADRVDLVERWVDSAARTRVGA